ncbi:hypothetical protein [Chrysiogenes arsenatis]|uniref:hypothetical protein n=1 Tax=Chrysiogenes arsenatis TaxID=309797 RepID=UPI00040E649C|nr:hypothetical protein [Chrysiogenes arsenatis]
MLAPHYTALFSIEELQRHQHDVMALLLQRLRQPSNIVALALDNTFQANESAGLWPKKASEGIQEILQCLDTIQHTFALGRDPEPVDLNSVIEMVLDASAALLRHNNIVLELCGKPVAVAERLNISRHMRASHNEACALLARKNYVLADSAKLFHAALGILAWLNRMVAAVKDRQPDVVPMLCFRLASQPDAIRVEILAHSVVIDESDSRARLLRGLLRQAIEGAELSYTYDAIGATLSLVMIVPLFCMQQPA